MRKNFPVILTSDGFKALMKEPSLGLPVRRTPGKVFFEDVAGHYRNYVARIVSCAAKPRRNGTYEEGVRVSLVEIEDICIRLESCIRHYQEGHSSWAYHRFDSLMDDYFSGPGNALRVIGNNRVPRIIGIPDGGMELFRLGESADVARMKKNGFSGFPDMFCLSSNPVTSLNGSVQQTASRSVKIVPGYANAHSGVKTVHLYDVAVKPGDVIGSGVNGCDGLSVGDHSFKSHYLYWYPLIAACSFIRDPRDDSHPENIVPQLLVEWVQRNSRFDKLLGVRYLQYSGRRTSGFGYSYVLPATNYALYRDGFRYCAVV